MVHSTNLKRDGACQRLIEQRTEEVFVDTLMVLVVRPRRAGKTTLVRKWAKAAAPISHLTISLAITTASHLLDALNWPRCQRWPFSYA